MNWLPVLRRRRVIAIFAVASVLSLLFVWDIHTLRLQASSGYNSNILEVRRYDGELSVFRVLYSKLRDANEANALMAARSNLSYDDGILNVEEEEKEAEKEVEAPVVDEDRPHRVVNVPTMKFRPLTHPPPKNEEQVAVNDMVTENNKLLENQRSKQIQALPPSSQDLDLSSKVHAMHKSHQASIDESQSSPQISHSEKQKTTVDAIKNLLLNNKTDNARALWEMSQNKPSTSEKKTSKSDIHTVELIQKQEDFRVRSYMSWPVPQYTRTDVLHSQWVNDLKQYLQGITERQVSVVTANLEHQEVVLNWLISAATVGKLSLKYIIVLSLSTTLHEVLISKKINSIYVSPSSVINSEGLKHIKSAFNQIHIVRLTFFRLMNHWNYDVVMYDSDAVILKNPQPLFDANPDAELIGSSGKGPDSVGHIWGRTICTGVLLMRCSPSLEMWWEKMSQIAHLPFTDQGLVNYALKALKVEWDKKSPLLVDRDMHGFCPGTTKPLRAVVLSEEKICRYSCDGHKRQQYYAWHKPAIKKNRTVENKRKRAQEGGAWLLRDDWMHVSKMNSLTGVTWLLAISQNT